MDGSDVAEQSAPVSRAVFLAVLLYFALVVYGTIATGPLAMSAEYAAEFVFGAIAVGLGAVLYRRSDGTPSAALGAAVCLVGGGALQFAYLLSRAPLFDELSSLAVFAGVGLYIYAAWTAE